jgi:hypothetical protein
MADQIPNKLHFIWVGNPIPDRQASTVLSWAMHNPGYTAILWTNEVKENVERLRQLAARFPSIMDDPSVDQQDSTHARLIVGNKTKKRYSEILVKSHLDLNEVMGRTLSPRYFKELEHRNYGGASDILRIALLKHEGGIYLDTDSDPGTDLPGSLTAEDGILFGVLQNRGFCNAVIAAPAGHQYLDEIADAMAGDYDHWEQEGLLAQYRRGVEDARGALDQARKGTNEQAIRNAKTQLQQQISSGTLLITGPTQVAIWLYLHTGGSHTPVAWAKDKLGPEFKPSTHLQQAEVVANFQNMVVGPRLRDPAIFKKYGFPTEYVTINSEASWVK